MAAINLDNAVEIGEGIHWVSQRDPKSLLQVNVYLRRFRGQNKSINLLIDPGPLEFFSEISRKIGAVVSDVSQVNMYSINHQDPDVGMNSTFISKINPGSVCLCSEDTWRLIKFFEIPAQSYKNVYAFNQHQVTLATDPSHCLEFIPTPFCHFVGAFALYDRNARTLFTGDLFGGLNPPGNMSLFADETHWDGVKMFHQIYMPSKKAVQNAIDAIRRLDPIPEMIVPQHGAILRGEMMQLFMNRLYNLEMGMDLFGKPDENKRFAAYKDILSVLLDKFVKEVGVEEAGKFLDLGNQNLELTHLASITTAGVQEIFSQPEKALNLLLARFEQYQDRALVNELKSLAIKETLLNRLPMPVSNVFGGNAPPPSLDLLGDSHPQEDDMFA